MLCPYIVYTVYMLHYILWDTCSNSQRLDSITRSTGPRWGPVVGPCTSAITYMYMCITLANVSNLSRVISSPDTEAWSGEYCHRSRFPFFRRRAPRKTASKGTWLPFLCTHLPYVVDRKGVRACAGTDNVHVNVQERQHGTIQHKPQGNTFSLWNFKYIMTLHSGHQLSYRGSSAA